MVDVPVHLAPLPYVWFLKAGAVVLSAYLFPLLSTGPFTLLKLSKVPPEFELTVTVPEPEK